MGTPNHKDDWDDLKTKGASGKVIKIANPITSSTGQIFKDWVGYNDAYDYRDITLNSAAKLSLTISATSNAAKFGIYQLVEKTDKKGNKTYSLKNVLTVTPKRDKNGNYVITTSGKLLEKGTYYIGVQATNAKKANASTDYTVSLNKSGKEASVFYNNSKSLKTDDWDDLSTKGAAGKVAKAVTVTASTGQFISDWVGFGDAVDYKGFSLGSAAKLSLTISATDAVKVALCELQSSNKKGKTAYSLKNLQSVATKRDKNGKFVVTTVGKLLEKGTYYLCVQSTNAAKGGNASYTVSLNKGGSEFFTKGSSNDNKWDAAPVLNGTLDNYGELNGSFKGWVGYGDPVDYRSFTTNANNGKGGYYIFDLEYKDNSKNNLNLTLYEVVNNKGTKSLKKLKTATANSNRHGVIGAGKDLLMLKANTQYVVGVEAPGAKQAKGSSYELAVYQDEFAHFNMANNERTKATRVRTNSSEIFSTLTKTAGGDSVDWYDISEFTGNTYDGLELVNTFESVALKLTFYTASMTETKVWLQDYDKHRWSKVSSKKLNTRYGVLCYFGDTKDIKYLKVEAASSARNSYCLSVR